MNYFQNHVGMFAFHLMQILYQGIECYSLIIEIGNSYQNHFGMFALYWMQILY